MKRSTVIKIAVMSVLTYLVVSGMTTNPPEQENATIQYSKLVENINSNLVREVTLSGDIIVGHNKDGSVFTTPNPGDPKLLDDLIGNKVEVNVLAAPTQSVGESLLIGMAPIVLLLGVVGIYIIMKRRAEAKMIGAQGGGGGGQPQKDEDMGKSKGTWIEPGDIAQRFDDVAGIEEAKNDVVEIVDFLKNPEKYEAVGGKIPHGSLLVGPPGTGKTLLARAIAGEAGVPFLTTSGSDFVEMYVGVGAARVRDMFAEAEKRAPCIIFIDEIDAVGKKRSDGSTGSGGNDEREQTLNALLVGMDGFDGKSGIIVLAATNLASTLDDALVRPGRFDREIHVNLPDIKGREQILTVHSQSVPLDEDVDLRDLACGTPGYSGAELANLVNEGALSAAREESATVTMKHLDEARDKLLMGAPKESMVMREEDLLSTAYHEAGHAIVGALSEEHDPVYAVSIMPRGGALGITMFLPEEDLYSSTRDKLESQVATLYAGRIAESLIYGENKVSTGASNDIERATMISRRMVTEWGFNSGIGALHYGDLNAATGKPMSEKLSAQIDDEIRELAEKNYKRAETILKDNIDVLENMTVALMEWNTISKAQVKLLLTGAKIAPPNTDFTNLLETV